MHLAAPEGRGVDGVCRIAIQLGATAPSETRCHVSDPTPAPKFVLIDGHSLLYRAFFATRFLSTSDGRPTNALFGFLNMLLTLLESERPAGIAVAFDPPTKTFRHAEYAAYKAQRKETPADFVAQAPVAREMMRAFGIPVIEVIGYEADDVVGTLAMKAKDAGYTAVIVTGDMDALQLVRDGVEVIATKRGVTDIHRYNTAEVVAQCGLTPEQVPDYKALRGDPSDNIPGIPGVGEKTAMKLLQQFGTIENLLENVNEIADEKLRAKVADNADICRQSRWLATIVQDAPIDYAPQSYAPDPATCSAAMSFLEDLEFRSVLTRLPKLFARYGASADEKPATAVTREPFAFDMISDPDTAVMTDALGSAPSLGIYVDDSGIAFSPDGRAGYWIPTGLFANDALVRALADPKLPKIAYDAKRYLARLRQLGHSLAGLAFDPRLAAYQLDPSRSGYRLESLVAEHLDATLPSVEEPASLAALHATAATALYEPMKKRLEEADSLEVHTTLELPLLPVLVEMEATGVKVDPDYLAELSDRLLRSSEILALEIYDFAGREFNIGSPKQIGEVLFGEMNIPGGKKTKTGAYSTGADLLQQLAMEHPIAQKILDWREVTKIRSTYAETLPRSIAADGRIHTDYNMTVAATGRLSSQDPNLQNIPIRSELGREIRRAFVAEDGWSLVSIDYSQIELRLLAHMSGDEALLEAFDAGHDIHSATAALLFGIADGAATFDQRRIAKTVNYATLYGQSDFGLAQLLRIPVSEAHQITEQYFARFPKVRAFTEGVIAGARAVGYTTTLMGRRRYFPELNAPNRMERLAAERAAVNAPIQGTAADLMKLAMIHVADYLKGARARMLLQVHDELVFECPDGEGERLAPEIGRIMSECYTLNVPLDVERKIGPNWRDMRPV